MVFPKDDEHHSHSPFQDCKCDLHVWTEKHSVASVFSPPYWADFCSGRNGVWGLPKILLLFQLQLLQLQLMRNNSHWFRHLVCSCASRSLHPVLFQEVRFIVQTFSSLFQSLPVTCLYLITT